MGESLYWKVEMKFPPPQSSPLQTPNDDHDGGLDENVCVCDWFDPPDTTESV